MKNALQDRSSERGSAGVKFAIFLAFLGLFAHAAYNYVPVAYEAESLKTEMHTSVMGLTMEEMVPELVPPHSFLTMVVMLNGCCWNLTRR